MRILQIGKFYPIRGGVEKVMWDLTRGLADQGVACDMLCCMLPTGHADEKDAPLHRLEGKVHYFRFSDNSQVICVPALAKKAATMLSPAMIRWLRRHHGEYDIIHIHHPDPMAALALRLSGFKGKTVLHWHSDIVSQQALLKLYQPLQRWLIRRADCIIGTTPVYLEASPWLRDVQDKCRVVPIGIHPMPADPGRTEALRRRFQGKTLLLAIGRLVPYKGFSYLVDALQFLPENFHLALCGEGPLRAQLEEQVARLGLGQRISLEGYLPDADLPAWYHAADVYVMSSVLKTEAFGIVQIEAMSCGTPVVATRIPGSGVSWVNKENVSGLNAIPGDPESLAQAILAVSADAQRYGEGARHLFQERYSYQKMIDSVRELYGTL